MGRPGDGSLGLLSDGAPSSVEDTPAWSRTPVPRRVLPLGEPLRGPELRAVQRGAPSRGARGTCWELWGKGVCLRGKRECV